jgi:hypothetical protein
VTASWTNPLIRARARAAETGRKLPCARIVRHLC